MSTIYSLAIMQLKDKLNLSTGQSKLKKYFFKATFSVIKISIITAIIYIVFKLLSFLRLISLGADIPVEFLIILFAFMYTITLFVTTIKMMNSLYFSRDNTVLLTMPATKGQLFISKILVFFIYEFVRNISFILPLFIAYGMINGYPIYYYFWLILCLTLITLLSVTIGGLLSIPFMQITIFLKKHQWVRTLLTIIVSCGVVYLIVKLISLLPENFDLVKNWAKIFWTLQDFLALMKKRLLPFTLICEFCVGSKVGFVKLFTSKTLINGLIILGFIAVVFIITYIFIRMLFFKMASVPFEFKKKKSKYNKKNVTLPSILSFIKKEMLLILRDAGKLSSLIITAVSMPLVIFLLNKIFMAMNLRIRGYMLVVGFNVVIIMLIILSSNSNLATSLSEEGGSAYLLKINPNKYIKSLFPKIILNIIIMTISLVITMVIFKNLTMEMCNTQERIFIDGKQCFNMFMMIELIYLAHAFWSQELDIMNPQTEQYRQVGSMINNPNELKASIIGVALTAIVGLLTIVNIFENENSMHIVWQRMLIVSIILLTLRVYLYCIKIKVYYKEK